MAIAIQGSTAHGPVADSSATFAHDSGSGSDRLLVVRVGLFSAGETPTVSSVTYGGVALTKKVGAEHLYAGGGNVVRCEYWYLDDPATGSNNVIVTLSGAGDSLSAIATTYTGASGVGTNSNTGGGNLDAYSLAITTAASTSLLDGCVVNSADRGVTAGDGVTQLGEVLGGNNILQWAGGKAATGGSDTWAVTLSSAVRSAAAVIEILEAGGGGPTEYDLTAQVGVFSLTSQQGALLADRLLSASQGSFSVGSQDADLLRGFLLGAVQGSYTLSGQDIQLTYTSPSGYALAAEAGSYSISGLDAGLLAARVMLATAGSYVAMGVGASLLFGRVLAASQGSYTLSSQDIQLLRGYLLSASQGAYALSTRQATLVWSGAEPTVTPASRIYVVPGEDRTYIVVFEDRTFSVTAENRTDLLN